jgi:hypothetical protein
VDHCFFRGMAAAALVREARPASQRRALRRLVRHTARQLARWRGATPTSSTWSERCAPSARACAGVRPKRWRYTSQSTERATARRYGHHTAFLLERRAALLGSLHRHTEASQELQRAIALYKE